jgi:CRP-like cAMP-binding protein
MSAAGTILSVGQARVILPWLSNPKIDALSRVPLFAKLGRKELEFLATRTDEVKVEGGRTLIRQGSPSGSFYLLLEGEATAEADGKARPPLKAGSFFGEISMMDGGPATATVVTTTPARLMVMSHAQFRDAIKANDQLLSQVLSVAADRLRRDYLEHHPT